MVPRSGGPPTWGAQLDQAARLLAPQAGDMARAEALTLLGALLGEPVALVAAQPATPMGLPDVEAYHAWVARRVAGEAIPYITGRLTFMGLDLVVERATPLVSAAARRLVEVTLECVRVRAPGELSAAEIGAGCGAVALALAAFEPRFARVFAADASPDALRVAAANGVRYLLNLVIDWREGDGLDAIPEPVDVIVCDASAPPARGISPQVERLFAQAPARLRPGGALLCALDGGLDSTLEREALASLARALPDARIWSAPSSDGVFVAVAQGPRAPSGQAGDAVFERGR